MAGESIVEQWETSREFYVLLEGAVDVLIEGERRDRMERGDFFGELAALDWGADFAYPRLAKVVAASDCRLLVLPAAVLNRLVRGSSAVSQLINDAVRRRLPGL